ncbi:site-specific integrase [Agromyces intestinalis]|uniref:Site-specific integrase n=1 Tax=Agromyces intestinalis TaxID=2592652 RepID=A0A5C1YKG1_9MICO|nr:tyrosine-type recombinase/integrase [Agromyces intestinalis]QEO15619.1 site-specific integrase [Agromyces intestinalis]
MAHVRAVERKNGVAYEVRWREGGKERQRTFSVKRDAVRHAHNVETALASATTTEPLTRGKTYREVAEAMLAAQESRLKRGTLLQYKALYEGRIFHEFGGQRIARIDSARIQDWITALTAAGLAPNTVRNHYIALNKVFVYAVKHRLITHNPCPAVTLPRMVHKDDFAPVFLTIAEVGAVAAEVDRHAPGSSYGLLIQFAASTGLRAAEIAGLRVRDVNLTAGHVEVRQTLKKIAGEWTVLTPKSRRSTRDVPLLDRGLIADLKLYLLQHPRSGDPDALLWAGLRFGRHPAGVSPLDYSRPVSTAAVRMGYLVPAAKRLGIADHMRLHDLRHTYASLMLAAGFQPWQVARWLGHANVSTTDAVYAHLYPSDYAVEVERFEAFVSDVDNSVGPRSGEIGMNGMD